MAAQPNSGRPPSPSSRRSSHTGRAVRGFAAQFVTLTILPLTALIVAVALGSVLIHQREMRSLVGDRDERAVRAAAVALSEGLAHRAASLRALADLAAAELRGRPEAGHTPSATLQSFLNKSSYLAADFDGGVGILSPGAAWLAASPPESAWQSRPIAELVGQIAPGAEPAFSVLFDDVALGTAAQAISAPSSDGTLVAVGVFSPAALDLPELIAGLGAGPRAHALLVSGDGRQLFKSGPGNDPANLLTHPGVSAALRGESGAVYVPRAGDEFVIAYSPVTPVGWALVVEEPWSDVASPLLRTSEVGPLVLIPALVLAGLGLVLSIRRVVRPLQQLERQSARLADGDFAAIEEPVGGIGEIESLQQTLVHMARQVRASQAAIRQYLGALTRAQEDERRRLAREMHDDTVQALIALDQRIQLARMAVQKGSPQAVERLGEARQMTTALIADIRRVIRDLRPIYLEDLGLLPAIEMLVRDLETGAGIQASFSTSGPARRLAPEHEIAVYRIVQEALSNVARHAAARSANVCALFDFAEFLIRLEDDGQGFYAPQHASELAASGHYGLMGMQERAELIGGRLNIQSTPGHGTTVELRLPL